MRNSTYTFVSISLYCSLVIGTTSLVHAKERPPEPIEKPGECPIDLPLRVANLDSLRHFEGLIGHCPETAILESPARQANRPRARVVTEGDEPEAIPAWQVPFVRDLQSADTIAAAGKARGIKVAPPRAPRTRAIASRDGTQVAIIPAPDMFLNGMDEPSDGVFAPPPATDEVEAVLALRPRSYSTAFDDNISAAARANSVDPLLLHAVIKQESSYRVRATSHVGARGLMQVMPATGRTLGVPDAALLYDPETNINAGARLLSQLWNRFDGNIDLVLAAYNAGEGAVRKYGNTVPPYRETQDYVVKVKANYQRLAAESGLSVNF